MTARQMSAAADLAETLRQMLAVLHAERHSLAALDLEGVVGAAADKRDLCGRAEQSFADAGFDPADPDDVNFNEECRGLALTAQRLNEANRQVRNLIAASVSARLEALTGLRPLYVAGPANLSAIPCR